MPRIEDTLFCDGCGVEVTSVPVVLGNQMYCCADCRDGLRCSCGDRMELEEERAGATSQAGEYTALNLYY